MGQVDVREGARRQHRKIALFCAIYCWIKVIDGVFIERSTLSRLIGIERFKGARLDWIIEDFKEFFLYVEPVLENDYDSQPEKFARVLLSKVKTYGGTEPNKNFPMFDFDWLRSFKFKGIFGNAVSEANRDEMLLSCFLTLLSQGQIGPGSMFPD